MPPIGNDIAADLRALVDVDIFDKSIFADINCPVARDFARQVEVVDHCAVKLVRRVIKFAVAHEERKVDCRNEIAFRVVAAQITHIGAAIFAARAQSVFAKIELNRIARRRDVARDVKILVAPVGNQNAFAARLNFCAARDCDCIFQAVNANANRRIACQQNISALCDDVICAENVQADTFSRRALVVGCVREFAAARVNRLPVKIFPVQTVAEILQDGKFQLGKRRIIFIGQAAHETRNKRLHIAKRFYGNAARVAQNA